MKRLTTVILWRFYQKYIWRQFFFIKFDISRWLWSSDTIYWANSLNMSFVYSDRQQSHPKNSFSQKTETGTQFLHSSTKIPQKTLFNGKMIVYNNNNIQKVHKRDVASCGFSNIFTTVRKSLSGEWRAINGAIQFCRTVPACDHHTCAVDVWKQIENIKEL